MKAEDYRLGANGYMIHRFDGKRLMHRDVWIEANGPIPSDHHIHHINKIRTDNRIENLQCMEKHAHMRLHGITFAIINSWERRKARTPPRNFECVSCGKDSYSQHPRAIFCSPECGRKYCNWRSGLRRSAQRLAQKKDLVCPVCAAPFRQIRNFQKFCSDSCGIKSWNAGTRNGKRKVAA